MNKSLREKQREARKEFQVILKRCKEIGFEYVVVRRPQEKICFGSGLHREVLPMEKNKKTKLGPGSYKLTYKAGDYPLKKKLTSPFVSSVSRFLNNRSITYVHTCFPIDRDKEQMVKQSFRPFGKAVEKVKYFTNRFTTPGPGTYHSTYKRQQIFNYSFGGVKIVKPAVMTICTTTNESRCFICKKQPAIDYWHCFQSGLDLCRDCMAAERKSIQYDASLKLSRKEKFYKLLKLDSYCKVRHCGFYHDHGNTDAAVQFLTNNEMKNKFRRENYLQIYNI